MKQFILFALLLSTMIVYSQDGTNSEGQSAVKKNSIMIESNFIMMSSISYDRYFPISNKTRFVLGGEYIMGTGFGWGAHWIVPELGANFFGPKHIMETSVQFAIDIGSDQEYIDMYGRDDSFGLKLAYRFQTAGGFNIRASANAFLSIDPIFVPTIGIGYSF